MDSVSASRTWWDDVANSALLVHSVSVPRAVHLANVTRSVHWTTFATVPLASADAVPTLTDASATSVNRAIGKSQ